MTYLATDDNPVTEKSSWLKSEFIIVVYWSCNGTFNWYSHGPRIVGNVLLTCFIIIVVTF